MGTGASRGRSPQTQGARAADSSLERSGASAEYEGGTLGMAVAALENREASASIFQHPPGRCCH